MQVGKRSVYGALLHSTTTPSRLPYNNAVQCIPLVFVYMYYICIVCMSFAFVGQYADASNVNMSEPQTLTATVREPHSG